MQSLFCQAKLDTRVSCNNFSRKDLLILYLKTVWKALIFV